MSSGQFIVTGYSFAKATKQITFPTISNFRLEGIQLITDLVTNTLIYQFNNPSLGGTLSGQVLTLTFNTNTGAYANGDALQIIYNSQQGDSAANRTATVTQAPAVTASAYAAGNVVGGLLTFANIVDAALSGILSSIYVDCKSVQTASLKLYLFNANPTASTFTDKSAPSINVADYAKLIDVITLGPADSGLGTHTLWTTDNIGKLFTLTTTSMYGVLITPGTPTFAATTDITVGVSVAKD